MGLKRFAWRCLACGQTIETPDREVPDCHCGTPMIRDYKSENVSNAYHPTRDVYGQKVKGKR